MTRAVALADLAPDAQERVRRHAGIALGPDSPLLPGLVNVKLENAIKSRRRARAGQWFERELEAVHAIYRAQGRAVLHRRVPPMVKLRGEWRHAGAGPCDFSGTVKGLGSVVFDAKSWSDATYHHEPKQYHQLEELRDVQALATSESPTRAFLLIACQPLSLAYLVEDLTDLLAHRPITLRTVKPQRTRAEFGTAQGFLHRYPTLTRAEGRILIAQDRVVWDWIPRLADTARPHAS